MLAKPGARKALIALLVGELRRVEDVEGFAQSFALALDDLEDSDRAKLARLLDTLNRLLAGL